MRTISFFNAVVRNWMGLVNHPRLLTYIVTFSCNARCMMCQSWRKKHEDLMSVSHVESIFSQLSGMDAVRLSGGEPFLHPELSEISRLAQKHLRPVSLYISSNGFLTETILKYCETRDKSIPVQMMISLDGYGSRHDQIRGVSGAWEKAMTTIQALAKRRREFNLKLCAAQTLIDAEGIEEYTRLKEKLKSFDVDLRVVAAYRSSATYAARYRHTHVPMQAGHFNALAQLSSSQWEWMANSAVQDASRFPWGDRKTAQYYWRGITNRMAGHKAAPNPRCSALNCHVRLLPNGDIPTCHFNSKTIGNACHHPFAEIWKSKAAQSQRKWIKECPGCWAECEIIPNAIYSADLIRHG